MKQIKSKKSQNKPSQLQSGTFAKTNCRLTCLPTELYSLNNLLTLDLSWNRIADLRQLSIKPNELICLRTVRYIDLSHNLLPNVQVLKPLTQIMKDLEWLNISENPLCCTLNYLYVLAFLFESIKVTTNETDLTINDQLRKAMFQLHHSGTIILQFMKVVAQLKAPNHQYLQDTQTIVENLKELQSKENLMEKSQGVFLSIRTFIRLTQQLQSHQLNYKIKEKHEINSLEQYEIPSSSFSPQAQLRASNNKELPLFYYRYMARQPKIQAKLLEELEVDEETYAFIEQNPTSVFDDYSVLIPHIVQKWQNQLQYSQSAFNSYYQIDLQANFKRGCSLPIQQAQQWSFSPLKSIQTGVTTQRQMLDSRLMESEVCYYGFDPDWFEQTRKFFVHRLLSFLRNTLVPISFPNSTYKRYLNDLEAGEISQWNLVDPMVDGRGGVEVLSPKSRNKFILSSSLSVLQAILTKIVFRKIRQAKLLKGSHLLLFEHVCSTITLRLQRLAFRNISQASFRFKCILNKLRLLKLSRVFLDWNQIKNKKMKLLRTLAKRKHKKETAFLSVALTQWRITARHLTTFIKLRHHSSSLAFNEKNHRSFNRSVQRSVSRKQVGKMGTYNNIKGQVCTWRPLKLKGPP